MPAPPNQQDPFQGRVAIVTGASSGVGAAVARRLAQEGLRTVLVARRQDRLTRLQDEIRGGGGVAHVIPADLASEADRVRIVEDTLSTFGPVDLLVNNAGLGWYGYAADMPWTLASEMVQVNVSAVVHLTLLVLPEMRRRSVGHIINIGSVAGTMGAQGVALYGGTKSLLASFSRALHREQRGTGVHVSLLQLGIVTGTGFYAGAASRPGALRMPAGRFGVTPQRVAKRVWALVQRPRKVAYVPPIVGAATWIEPLFGWFLDLAGPAHLRRESGRARPKQD